MQQMIQEKQNNLILVNAVIAGTVGAITGAVVYDKLENQKVPKGQAMQDIGSAMSKVGSLFFNADSDTT